MTRDGLDQLLSVFGPVGLGRFGFGAGPQAVRPSTSWTDH